MEFCQSCGMPLNEEVLGTEKNGEKNKEYCIYCYENGGFKDECSIKDMEDVCVKYIVESGDMDETSARKTMQSILPTLKRWK